jgi:hypothetical protein
VVTDRFFGSLYAYDTSGEVAMRLVMSKSSPDTSWFVTISEGRPGEVFQLFTAYKDPWNVLAWKLLEKGR